MNDFAINVESLGKAYLVGHQTAAPERYTALRDVLARNVTGLVRKTRDMLHGRPIIQGDEVEEFWALQDVSFAVNQGEALGIIGRNGAGKSTLLKILSRITEPTTGRVSLNGRVASLLEVGTGFHPELTGRENIFLNGAILGMTRAEIRRKFAEIVAFAEVEQFLDTPVKRYSSGMYVRLAFAVAAHLESEILIVDEVLAVGDASFQKRCLQKMDDVASCGRTVIFVSHNLAAVQMLCNRALILDHGKSRYDGGVDEAVAQYLVARASCTPVTLAERADRSGSGHVRLRDIRLHEPSLAKCGQPLTLDVDIEAKKDMADVFIDVDLGINTAAGVRLFWLSTHLLGQSLLGMKQGDAHRLRFEVERLPLVPGDYSVVACIRAGMDTADWMEDAFRFSVQYGQFYGINALNLDQKASVLVPFNVAIHKIA